MATVTIASETSARISFKIDGVWKMELCGQRTCTVSEDRATTSVQAKCDGKYLRDVPISQRMSVSATSMVVLDGVNLVQDLCNSVESEFYCRVEIASGMKWEGNFLLTSWSSSGGEGQNPITVSLSLISNGEYKAVV